MRTLLTGVGVAVGSFVLIASLAIGEGIQEVILGQLRKQDQLRRILVWPGGGPRPRIPSGELELEGEMTAARRDRLREAIQRRWKVSTTKPPPGLTAEQIQALAQLDHVEVVTPALSWIGTIRLGGASVQGVVRVATEDDAGFARRLVAGRPFAPGEKALALSEHAAYRLGFKDEAEVKTILNQRPRLTLAVTQPNLGNLLFLLNVSRPDLSPAEKSVLGKVMKQLPRALASLDLTDSERKTLLGMLSESRPEASRAVERSLPVAGVVRDVARAELGPWDGPPRPIEVILSPAAAREMYFAVPGRAQDGLPQVTVRVDREEAIRGVEEKIKEMGLETFCFAELLDQVRVYVLLISISSTLVGGIALAVAALGITNTMLMSVLERTFEIGLMKATGARDGDVMGLFLMEGTLIGAVGSVAGLVAAWLFSYPGDRFAHHLIATRTPMQLDGSVFVFRLWIVIGVPLGVCLLTTLAAIYPAWRAARIDPIEALRQRG